ncbi:hypothetical protein P1J78_20355 [Psychromarinibacter sp. C21-152]|uniref:Uncharacterized protein n=1 Tax=Psychromarinibacter sediminicola TaxID=3033385 RepID=A0AAE3NY59_9RHOB|nr:hypothetical protein [Psychromarinibacter sediminicola]MDF0603105.1 hypothetical protein [Psychromarinibacter sediminicola]
MNDALPTVRQALIDDLLDKTRGLGLQRRGRHLPRCVARDFCERGYD